MGTYFGIAAEAGIIRVKFCYAAFGGYTHITVLRFICKHIVISQLSVMHPLKC